MCLKNAEKPHSIIIDPSEQKTAQKRAINVDNFRIYTLSNDYLWTNLDRNALSKGSRWNFMYSVILSEWKGNSLFQLKNITISIYEESAKCSFFAKIVIKIGS